MGSKAQNRCEGQVRFVGNDGKGRLAVWPGWSRRGKASATEGMGCGRWSLCCPFEYDDGQVLSSRVLVDVKLEPGSRPAADEGLR